MPVVAAAAWEIQVVLVLAAPGEPAGVVPMLDMLAVVVDTTMGSHTVVVARMAVLVGMEVVARMAAVDVQPVGQA
ncbi:MAG: hypothetical protein NVSMB27_45300 [Ktedonobacteraceae bacterium]